MTQWIDPARGIVWSNIVPLGVRVVAGPPVQILPPKPRPDLVPGRNAPTLADRPVTV